MRNFIISVVAFSMVMVAPVATTAQSFNQPYDVARKFCNSLVIVAEGSMWSRQNNVSQNDVLEGLARSIDENEPPAMMISLALKIVIVAYNEPIYQTVPAKQAAVQRYKDSIRKECLAAMSSQ